LLDQRVIAGLGNIYVCESLWRSCISPKRQAAKIKPVQFDVLVPAIKAVLQEAVRAGGFVAARSSADEWGTWLFSENVRRLRSGG